jgi:hypothetical protein
MAGLFPARRELPIRERGRIFIGKLWRWLVAERISVNNVNPMPTTETIEIQATPGFRQTLEGEASKLNLTLSAYVLYLHSRLSPGRDVARLDRHVKAVFGQHGELMRRLAK